MAQSHDETKTTAHVLSVTYDGNGSTYQTRVPTTLRFTDVDQTVTFAGLVAANDPKLTVTLPERDGLVKSRPLKVELSSAWGFIQEIASGRAHRPFYDIALDQYLWDPTDGVVATTGSVIRLFKGRLHSIESDPSGRPDVTKLTCVDFLTLADIEGGVRILPACHNVFGGSICGKDLIPEIATGTLSALNDTEWTITGLPARSDGHWNNGVVYYQGFEVKIKEWVSGTTFRMTELAPSVLQDLVDASTFPTVEVVPGCDKSPRDCQRWGRIESFNGLGFASPARHPVFERE